MYVFVILKKNLENYNKQNLYFYKDLEIWVFLLVNIEDGSFFGFIFIDSSFNWLVIEKFWIIVI